MYSFDPILRRLKNAKTASGFTNKELSEKSGVPLGTVNKILSGDTAEPKLPAIMALADALTVSADFLIYGDRKNMRIVSNVISSIIDILSEINIDGQEEVLKYARYVLLQPEYKKDSKHGSMEEKA